MHRGMIVKNVAVDFDNAKRCPVFVLIPKWFVSETNPDLIGREKSKLRIIEKSKIIRILCCTSMVSLPTLSVHGELTPR